MIEKVCILIVFIINCIMRLILPDFAFPWELQVWHFLSSFFLLVAAELPLEFPDGTTPVTCRVSVYDSSPDIKVGVGALMNKAIVPPLPAGSLYMEEVHAKVGVFPFHHNGLVYQHFGGVIWSLLHL